jgi:multiple antibiotic resistance protein
MHIASIALTLFLVLDPFGNIVVIHNALSRVPAERRTAVLLRELLIALGILLFFLFAGSFTLALLGIRQDALSISGGILLFLIALGMVFPEKSVIHENGTEEPFIVPIGPVDCRAVRDRVAAAHFLAQSGRPRVIRAGDSAGVGGDYRSAGG